MLVKFLGKGICMYRTEWVRVFVKNSSRVWSVVFSSSTIFNVASNQPAPMRSLMWIKYQKRKHFHSQLWILKTGDERKETESDAPAARETYPPEIVRELLSVLGTTHVQQVRGVSLLVSVFISGSSGSGSSPGRGHCAVFLGKTLAQCLSPPRCTTEFNAGAYPAIGSSWSATWLVRRLYLMQKTLVFPVKRTFQLPRVQSELKE